MCVSAAAVLLLSGLYVCLTLTLCAIHSSGSVPTHSHPRVSTFLRSSLNKGSRPTVNCGWAVTGVTGSLCLTSLLLWLH